MLGREVLDRLGAVLADRVAAARLRPVERAIGEAEQVVRAAGVLEVADSDRDREVGRSRLVSFPSDLIMRTFEDDLRRSSVRLG
ncbi:MAG: hypothetical protein ABI317_14770 [Gaiellales bacterium]